MSKITRRDFVKIAAGAAAGVALYNFGGEIPADKKSGENVAAAATSKAKVYFTKKIDAEHLI